MTNKNDNVFYSGVSSDLKKRVYEHKEKLHEGFSNRYNLTKLIYFEAFESIEEAIQREKQIKAGSREKKIKLILKKNPDFRDLYEDII